MRWSCTGSIAPAATGCWITTNSSGRRREEFASEPLIPPPLITGRDLIALGLKPGPRFKEILEAVQSRQLEGKLRTPEEALEWAERVRLTPRATWDRNAKCHRHSSR